jgi:hypothetical protein
MATLSMTFTNYSTTSWQLDYNDWELNAFSGITQQPGPTMQAGDGQQTLACNVDWFSGVAQGLDWIACTWRNPSGFRFGVVERLHFQMFGIGPRPYWLVMSDQGAAPGSTPNWQDSGRDPSSPYTWTGVPYSIVATPNSQHTSLSVDIIIGDTR